MTRVSIQPRAGAAAATDRRYLVVIELEEVGDEGRQTGRIERRAEVTKVVQDHLVSWLETQGVTGSQFEFEEPSAIGTFGVRTSADVAKALRDAPRVQAVLES